jgi:uncharacterized protein (TIGR02757 family)
LSVIDLKIILDKLVSDYNINFLDLDPLQVVLRYKTHRDQEIAGFIAASLAIGNVHLIRKAVNEILNKMGQSPFCFVLEFDPFRDKGFFDDFTYRFYTGKDIGLLIWLIKQIYQEKGSLRELFLECYDSNASHIGSSLSRFVQSILNLKINPYYDSLPPKGSGIRHFIADPSDGSGCKRLNLFLRWMVRREDPDLGIWSEVLPSKLVIPLDTHIARLGKNLGLTQRRTADWKMALEITDALKRFDSNDPVKYDFALCTVGKLNRCPDSPNRIKCNNCPILQFCKRLRR